MKPNANFEITISSGFQGVESLQKQDPVTASQPQHHRGRRRRHQQDHCDTGATYNPFNTSWSNLKLIAVLFDVNSYWPRINILFMQCWFIEDKIKIYILI